MRHLFNSSKHVFVCPNLTDQNFLTRFEQNKTKNITLQKYTDPNFEIMIFFSLFRNLEIGMFWILLKQFFYSFLVKSMCY